MILLDTNIFIYLGTGALNKSVLSNRQFGYASIVKIETLGYRKITSAEERALENILDSYQCFDLNPSVIDLAIALRQDKNLSLGDAIVAATALVNDLVLWTANTSDFANINGLKIHNPLVH